MLIDKKNNEIEGPKISHIPCLLNDMTLDIPSIGEHIRTGSDMDESCEMLMLAENF